MTAVRQGRVAIYSYSTGLLSDGTAPVLGFGRFRGSLLLWLVDKMKDSMRQDGYISNNLGDGVNAPQEKTTGFGSNKRTAGTSPLADHDSGYGVVEDHYGGKKLGMTRVRITTSRHDPVNA